MKFFQTLLPVLFFALAPLSANHTPGASDLQAQEPVRVELVAEDQTIQAGRPFWVGIKMQMQEGWDTYWVNPGDAGFPTQVDWQLPEGFTADAIEWPYPEKFESESMVGYGYTGNVMLLAKVTPPKTLDTDHVTLAAEISWLACNNACVPGQASVSLPMQVSTTTPALNMANRPEFTKARDRLPHSGEVAVNVEEDSIILTFVPDQSMGSVMDAVFFPEQGMLIDSTAPQDLGKVAEGYALNVKLGLGGDLPENIKGVLLIRDQTKGIEQAIQVDTQFVNAVVSHAKTDLSLFFLTLGLAFVGGLILNVMPCVLPVIALKIFSFVKMADQKRSEIVKHGGAFAGGVVVSFWILSGALLLLRAYGQGIGWGFQLQEPVFVAILASILFLLGLSLFGLFEMGTSLISLGNKTSKIRSPLWGAFFSGVLATLVATPCTGPLLGPAVGFAMTLPAIMALLVFTSLGLGMAFPYVLFSFFPALVKYLPKPGNWMTTFKQLMGFVMMATVAWLVWVFGAQTGNMAIFFLLVSFLILAIGGWIFGRWATPLKKKRTRLFATAISLFLILGGGAIAIDAARKPPEDTGVMAHQNGWESFSPERVRELRAAGTPVFVDFTAKWCLICQANKVTLHSSDVQKAFNQAGVVTMMADWTKKDNVITKELEKFGRSGVPLYVLYPGDSESEPHILPQTLSSKTVAEYLTKLDNESFVASEDSQND